LIPAQQWRLLRAIAASVITGAAIYLLVMHIGLPAIAAQLTDAQVARLRQAFVERPAIVLGAIVGIAGCARPSGARHLAGSTDH
jgi:hypothetical protein